MLGAIRGRGEHRQYGPVAERHCHVGEQVDKCRGRVGGAAAGAAQPELEAERCRHLVLEREQHGEGMNASRALAAEAGAHQRAAGGLAAGIEEVEGRAGRAGEGEDRGIAEVGRQRGDGFDGVARARRLGAMRRPHLDASSAGSGGELGWDVAGKNGAAGSQTKSRALGRLRGSAHHGFSLASSSAELWPPKANATDSAKPSPMARGTSGT